MLSVLVVEDELVLRALIAEVLVEAGFGVCTAGNGNEAVLAIRARMPDVVLLDLVMPQMDGWSFLAYCRANPTLREIPIGILSAVPNADATALFDRSTRAIRKPFDIDELLEAVTDLASAGAASLPTGVGAGVRAPTRACTTADTVVVG